MSFIKDLEKTVTGHKRRDMRLVKNKNDSKLQNLVTALENFQSCFYS